MEKDAFFGKKENKDDEPVSKLDRVALEDPLFF